MKKLILSLLIVFTLAAPINKAHAVDAKGKAFLIICTYGTVGGALLGFATMAFGTNSRAIAQGASLGLYAGIAFGSYVIFSHQRSLDVDPEMDEDQGPPPGFDDQGGFGAPPPEDSGGFFDSPQRTLEINNDLVYNYKLKKGRNSAPPIYLPLVNIVF